MSNIEHLLENAIATIENNKEYDEFVEMPVNQDMFKCVKATPEEIWSMAIYTVCTYKKYQQIKYFNVETEKNIEGMHKKRNKFIFADTEKDAY